MAQQHAMKRIPSLRPVRRSPPICRHQLRRRRARQRSMSPAPPVYNWTGFYLGINGGWGFGKSDWSVPGFSTGNFNVNGGLVGGTLGFNWWADGWVLGVEGDFDGSWMDGKSSLSVLQFNAKPRASGSPHCDRASATLPTASCST